MQQSLTLVVLVYPIYWFVEVFLHAVPPFLYAAVTGRPVDWVQLNHLNVAVGVDGAPRYLPLIAAVVLPLLTWRWRGNPVAGIVLASAGHIGLQPLVWRAMARHPLDSSAWILALWSCLLLGLGLRWTISALPSDRLGQRVLRALLVPLVFLAIWRLYAWHRHVPIPSRVLWSHLPAFAIAVLVAMRPSGRAYIFGRKTLIAGAASLLSLLFAVPVVHDAIETAIERSRRAVLDRIPPPANAPYEKFFFQKGVNFTAESPGGYSSPAAMRLLAQLPQHGINAVALVPYGFVPRDSTGIRFPGGMERDEGIEALSRIAHHNGMKVLLKPQLWASGFRFPGELNFDGERRLQFFASYRLFLEHYARLATKIHADLFCVGTELARLSGEDAQWRRLIARTRELYQGPLTYAATQGPEFESIRFWDALDYIGLNNYYPLPDSLSADSTVETVQTVQRRYGLPVIFTEAGFSSFDTPHRAPWDETPRKLDADAQARAYEAVFRAFYDKAWFSGVYWWKVGTNGYGGLQDGSHTPWRKPAMDVISRWYLKGR